MEWYHNLYIGKSVLKKEAALRAEMEKGHFRRGIKILTLAYNGKDLLDIRNASSLGASHLQGRVPMIVGLAGSRDEAVELAARIVEDCIRETGGVGVREYLSDR